MEAITLQESRIKLMPWAIGVAIADALACGYLVQAHGKVAQPASSQPYIGMVMMALLAWSTIWLAWGMIRPYRIDVSTSELRITSWGLCRSYAWAELDDPHLAVIDVTGNRDVTSAGPTYTIKIPRLDRADASPLRIRTDCFANSPHEVFSFIGSAKRGRLVAPPPAGTAEAMASMSGRACTWVLNAISGWAVEVVAGVFNAFFKL